MEIIDGKIGGFVVSRQVEALINVRPNTPRGKAEPLVEKAATFYRLHEEGAADAIVMEIAGAVWVGTTDFGHTMPGIASAVATHLGVEIIYDAAGWVTKYGI